MAVDLTPEQQALADADDALRDGRHLLERMCIDLLGTRAGIPPDSEVGKIIEKMRSTGDQCRRALMGRSLTKT